MTIEEAREYWCRRLERAEGYSDEHWDAEERHAHKDFVDAMTHAITALAIRREQAQTVPPKTNGDMLRKMPDEQLAMVIGRSCIHCVYQHEPDCTPYDCYSGKVEFLKKEADEDAGSKTD